MSIASRCRSASVSCAYLFCASYLSLRSWAYFSASSCATCSAANYIASSCASLASASTWSMKLWCMILSYTFLNSTFCSAASFDYLLLASPPILMIPLLNEPFEIEEISLNLEFECSLFIFLNEEPYPVWFMISAGLINEPPKRFLRSSSILALLRISSRFFSLTYATICSNPGSFLCGTISIVCWCTNSCCSFAAGGKLAICEITWFLMLSGLRWCTVWGRLYCYLTTTAYFFSKVSLLRIAFTAIASRYAPEGVFLK